MFTLAGLDEIGRSVLVLKIVGGLFEQCRLIALGGEMIVCSTLNQIVRQLALSEQGIGGDGSPGDIEAIEQGNGRLYLVGLFLLIAAFGADRADFFWV